MPTTLPGIPVARAREVLRQQDAILESFPEVVRVWGKAGRAETATDPAGLNMFETTITLKPTDQWPDPNRVLDPAVYSIWKERTLVRATASTEARIGSTAGYGGTAGSIPTQ